MARERERAKVYQYIKGFNSLYQSLFSTIALSASFVVAGLILWKITQPPTILHAGPIGVAVFFSTYVDSLFG